MFKLLSLPFKLTKLILVGAGLVVLLAVFSYGAVRAEQAKRLEDARAKEAIALSKQKDDSIRSLQHEVSTLESEAQMANAKLGTVCTNFKTVAAKYRVALPTFCQ